MRQLTTGAALAAALMTTPALAQRTDDNAVKQADDAFGKSVGDEQIGIYNPENVRSFSPVAAGNVRIEGLYFDQQVNPTQRLIAGSAIRVGISAQGYPFPAPTGIADYSLRRPGADALLSVAASYGPYGTASIEADTQLPIDGDRLGAFGGFGLYRDKTAYFATPKILSLAAGLRYAPRDGIEIIPFWSQVRVRDEEVQSLIFTDGGFLPPRIGRDRFFGQKWADFSGNLTNYGVVARADALGLDIRFGLFRSVFDLIEDHVDLLLDVDETGRAGRRLIIAAGDDQFASTSGELRVSKTIDEGPRRHLLIGSLRARRQNRAYGGEAVIDLGPSQIGVQDFRPKPAFTLGPNIADQVRQHTFGLGYQGRWREVGELSIGVQKTDYTKRVTGNPVSKDAPWLLSVNGAAYLSDTLALYGGYTRGLEESPVAPGEAVNLNEAPPAIRTEQKEAGIRWRVTPGFTAVAGVFDIRKPYFNLDAGNRFRQLGEVRHRGIELSLAGQLAKGLNLVFGNVLLDADVSGEEVRLGVIGNRPVATFVRYTVAAIDYKLPMVDGLSLSANFESTSDRVANSANTLFIPARSVIGLGARYNFEIAGKPFLLRANVGNLLNTFGFGNGSSGVFVPNGARRYSLSLAADL